MGVLIGLIALAIGGIAELVKRRRRAAPALDDTQPIDVVDGHADEARRLVHGKSAPQLAAERRELERAWAPIRDYLVNDDDMRRLVAGLEPPNPN